MEMNHFIGVKKKDILNIYKEVENVRYIKETLPAN